MIPSAMAQFDRLTVFQRAVRDHFREGGSATAVLLVLLALAGIVLLVLVLSRRALERRKPETPDEPFELFRAWLSELELSQPQRRLLLRVATDLKLEHPAVLLLCPALFDRHLATWKRRFPWGGRSEGEEAIEDEAVRRLRGHLFPEVLARVGTRHLEWDSARGEGSASWSGPE